LTGVWPTDRQTDGNGQGGQRARAAPVSSSLPVNPLHAAAAAADTAAPPPLLLLLLLRGRCIN